MLTYCAGLLVANEKSSVMFPVWMIECVQEFDINSESHLLVDGIDFRREMPAFAYIGPARKMNCPIWLGVVTGKMGCAP